jgi:hypothetical protein
VKLLPHPESHDHRIARTTDAARRDRQGDPRPGVEGSDRDRVTSTLGQRPEGMDGAEPQVPQDYGTPAERGKKIVWTQ